MFYQRENIKSASRIIHSYKKIRSPETNDITIYNLFLFVHRLNKFINHNQFLIHNI